MEQTVELWQMLEARDRRAARQKELLARYRRPLVWFTMNIAGPVKTSPLIRRGFRSGCALLEGQLARAKAPCLHREEYHGATGDEACYVADLDPAALKRLTVELEEHCAFGRLFDMDVLAPGGEKLDRASLGLGERRCLVCGGPARVCARSRAHTVEELQKKTEALLREALDRQDAQTVAALACRALLYEVGTTPKPGLVDRLNSGSHRDMDFFTFMDSAAALWPYFEECARVGQRTAADPPEDTFAALRGPARLAENAMLRATGGANTHKGAIFTVGTLCGALGRLPREAWREPETVLSQAAAMTEGLVERELAGLTEDGARTTGQKLYLRHGITGVRGQIEAGLPAVKNVGLPTLERGLAQGKSLNVAGCAALLAMLAAAVDTNLIARGGLDGQREAAEQAARLLEREPFPSREVLEELDRQFIEKNLSPGGSADLLAVCYLLHFLRTEAF